MLLFTLFYCLAATLSADEAREIGLRVWQNESGCRLDGLTCWNEGEEFASLGVGHFIWYPRGKDGRFVETFPQFIQYLREQKVPLPRWLDEAHFCPWKDRKSFLAAKNDKKMCELRKLLQQTIDHQAQFLLQRLERTVPELTAKAPAALRPALVARYERVLKDPAGLFALLDYVNFKGYGTSDKERYCGSGWGLYQVLENMSDDPDLDPLLEFVRSAKAMLEQRIANAPAERNEQRYLKGWFYRLDTYVHHKSPLLNHPKKKA